MSKRNNDDNTGLGCGLMLLALVFAMPLVGVYMLSQKNASEEEKTLGAILAVVGFILWIVLLINN